LSFNLSTSDKFNSSMIVRFIAFQLAIRYFPLIGGGPRKYLFHQNY
jgi:hypothetical protein